MAIAGVGTVASAVKEALAVRGFEFIGSGAPITIAASDTWSLASLAAARRRPAPDAARLPVHTRLGTAIVGPVEGAGYQGCSGCVERRRPREWQAVRKQHADALGSQPSAWLTSLAASLLAAIVADEVGALVSGAAARTEAAVLEVDLASLAVKRRRFLPDPTCDYCGSLPPDSAESAQLSLAPSPSYAPGTYRARDLGPELERLSSIYVEDQVGIVRSLEGVTIAGLEVTSAPVGARGGIRLDGYGRASTLRASQLIALLEGLERFGSFPAARRSTVHASFEEVQSRALDPRSLGLHPTEQYEIPDFHYQPYSPDQKYRWVWGWSFQRSEPILVPESCSYYSAPHDEAGGHGFVFEISNGCALGGSLEEAILYGLLEVAERDAFLLTWYSRLPARLVDLTLAQDDSLPLLLATIRAQTGYEVRLHDITAEQRIPSVWAMAVNPHEEGGPAVFCSAGSHPQPERAVRNALQELGPSLALLSAKYADPSQAARARQLAEDSDLVRDMDDHSLLYADPQAARRTSFLQEVTATRDITDIGGHPGGLASDDLCEVLTEAVGRYTSSGLDVIVVDQTTPEHRVGGLSCVKVLIPGTLPMTFGHRYRRIVDLPRLYEVPQLLRYRERPMRPDEVNPYPHPFP